MVSICWRRFQRFTLSSSDVSKINPASQPEPQCPDIFLCIRIISLVTFNILWILLHFKGRRIKVTAKSIEELPRLNYLLTIRLLTFPKGGHATVVIYFLRSKFALLFLEHFRFHSFMPLLRMLLSWSQRILPQHGRLSHIINICFGGGCEVANLQGYG